MSSCCARRRSDGTIDREEVDRAVRGRPATISREELEIVTYRLSRERGWGLSYIAQHTGWSRTQIAEILAKQKRKAG